MRSTTGWSERSTPKCQNIPTRPLSDAHRAQATSVRKYGPPLGATVRKCLPTSARPQHTPPPAPPRLTETNQTFRGMHHDRSNTASTSRAFATHLRRALATALALLSDHGPFGWHGELGFLSGPTSGLGFGLGALKKSTGPVLCSRCVHVVAR